MDLSQTLRCRTSCLLQGETHLTATPSIKAH